MVQVTVQSAKALYDSVMTVVDSMLYSREQRFNRERNIAMRTLFEQGETSSADIIRAKFGGEMPHGLDLQYLPDFKCTFHSLGEAEHVQSMSAREKLTYFSRVAGLGGQDERIYIHPGYRAVGNPMGQHEQALTRIIAHEHTHRLQGEDRQIGWDNAMDGMNTAFLTMPRSSDNLWDGAKNLCRVFAHAVMDIGPTYKSGKEMNIKNYLSRECEIQARMDEVMMEGYASWQKMPTTRLELWAALESAGMDLPRSVRRELRSEEGRQARRDFRMSGRAQENVAHVVKQLSQAEGLAIFAEDKDKFWHEAVPRIYGNLIELYGDTEGRARMGLGTNPIAAKQILRTVAYGEDEITSADAARMVDALPPEHADRVLKSLLRSRAGGENVGANTDRVIDALFENDATRAVLFDHTAYIDAAQDSGLPAWIEALQSGNTELLQRYVDHGFAFDTKGRMQNMVYNFEADICMIIKGQRHSIELLADPDNAKLAKPAVKAFGRATVLNNIQEALNRQQAATQFLLDSGIDIDQPMHDADGNVSTIRDAAAEVGVFQRISDEGFAVKTGSDDTAHL
ncbi:MAG: hypothetical protein VXY16_04660 [Pseudomonadota bacterium]|nr:hypothetical protein [Pseudomonadota bacterium]